MAGIGSTLTFEVTFTDAAGAAADPDTVGFWLREGIDGTESEWIYDASPVEGTHFPVGANAIVRASAGVYSVAWVTRKAERHTGAWAGSGTVPTQSSEISYLVRHSGIAALEP
jgi:hypothetical protein